jgi:hypothetical protein
MTRTTITRRQLWQLFCVECGTAKPTPELAALGLVDVASDPRLAPFITP